jgi:UDP-N-acetylmuramate dehydrogenase
MFQEYVNLAPYTTFGVPAQTRLWTEVANEEDIFRVLYTYEWEHHPHLFLGTWANILFTKDFEGLVVKVDICGKEVLEKSDKHVILEVGAGENWNELVYWTIEQWWAGLENMIGIPSSVGAAAFGNIWAYGAEIKDRIVSVTGIHTENKKVLTFYNEQCQFWYRESIFKRELKDSFLISKVVFKLDVYHDDYPLNTKYKDIQAYFDDSDKALNLKNLANAISEIRASKLPDWRMLGTAGSFFKNPIVSKSVSRLITTKVPNLVVFDIPGDDTHVKLSAGQLIELAGFKGYKKWFAGVYDKHALILVNHGWATGQDIADLAGEIQDRVQKLFSVSLSPEVIYV